MRRMLIQRLGFAVLALWVVSVLVFMATEALPGDAAIAQLGKSATPAALASLRARMHLNEPLVQQYLGWLGELLRGDLGRSFTTDTGVGQLIGNDVTHSLALMVLGGAIALPLAGLLGIWMAVRRERATDHVVGVLLLIFSALPEFVICVLAVALLSTNVLHVLPAVSLIDPSRPTLDQPNLLVLPVLTLVLISLPYVARTVRSCMIEALESEYVTMARLKGVPERTVIFRHALPNIAGPAFQVAAQSLAYLAGGIVVIETVFQFPGIGYAFVSAVQSRDLPVVQALALLLSGFYVVLNIVADLGTVAMTPTLRKGCR